MVRTVLVVVHASAGIAGLFLGLLAFRLRPGRPGPVRLAYATALGVLLASLLGLLAMDWTDLDTGARVAFSGLAVLAVVMMYRIVRAIAEADTAGTGWEDRYIHHVFFTYIALWIGFGVLPALSLPHPQVAVPLVAAATLLVGQQVVRRYRRRVLTDDMVLVRAL